MFFLRSHVGPLHNIQGYQEHGNVSKCRPQHSGDLYQATYKIWKQSDKDFLSYHENDEVSADAAAA